MNIQLEGIRLSFISAIFTLQTFRFRKIYETVKYLDELERQGLSSVEAWDKCAVELTKCAKVCFKMTTFFFFPHAS